MRIVILATRLAGNDGVTLEAKNWKHILERMGHRVTFVAGKLDCGGVLIPELHFQTPSVVELYDKVVYGKHNYKKVESEIFIQAGVIEGKLRTIFRKKKIDLLIVPNVLSLPMHFSFAVALTRVLHDIPIPTIARHHDFWWERKRFLRSSMFPFFKKYFPPLLPNIAHVVINSKSEKDFIERMNITPTIIWDTVDFSKEVKSDTYSKTFRKSFGIASDDCVYLQATRLVPRKRIELAIKFVERLNDPKAVLLIAGHAGDEGVEYEKYLREVAANSSARVMFIGESINSQRRIVDYKSHLGKIDRKRIYTLWDCYLNCDFVTYPTHLEGFGNQFVEAVLFKKPIIMTEYPVFKSDIKPLGFKVIEMPINVNASFIKEFKKLSMNQKELHTMTTHNFELGKKYLSYDWSEEKIRKLLLKLGL